MDKPKRIVALILMTLIATVIPATYQKAIEPREKGNGCAISITSLKLDTDQTGKDVVFQAYLRIENTADVDVILSRLDLDVYHISESEGTYRYIGTFTTNAEYTIPAAEANSGPGYIETWYLSNGLYQSHTSNGDSITNFISGVDASGSDISYVYGTLVISQDLKDGTGSTEAMKKLIEGDQLSLKMKGTAKISPFEFNYETEPSITANIWDNNFIITDVYNYYSEPDLDKTPTYDPTLNNTDTNVYVVAAKMRNNGTFPMIIQDWNFNLTDDRGDLIATGVPSSQLTHSLYDPDYYSGTSRQLLFDTQLGSTQYVYLPPSGMLSPGESIWKDILFVFNFTDPNYPFNPELTESKTKDNLKWFFESLFSSQTIENVQLQGEVEIVLGIPNENAGENEPNYKGIQITLGEDSAFKLDHVKFHQFPESFMETEKNGNTIGPYTDSDYEKYINYRSGYTTKPADNKMPISLEELLTVGDMNVTDIDINRTSNDITFGIDASLSLENPYRLAFNITNLATDYYQLSNIDDDISDGTDLAQGTTGSSTLVINRALPKNSSAKPSDLWDSQFGETYASFTQIPHHISLLYNTDDYEASGIANLFSDLGFNTTLLNMTNPLWLMGPEGIQNYEGLDDPATEGLDPLDLIEYLIENEIDPLMLLKNVNTSIVHYYGDNAYYPLEGSYFGTNPIESDGNDLTEEGQDYDPITQSVDFPTNNYNPSQRYYIPTTIVNNWYQSYPEITKNVQYEIVRNHLTTPFNWQWAGDEDGYNDKFNGLICNNLDGPEVLGLGSNWLPAEDDVIWRIYADNSQDYWGYAYDQEDYLRNWYIVHGANPSKILFRQDFVLDDTKIQSPEQIEGATLSISYRYPSGVASDKGRIGIGYWDPTANKVGVTGTGRFIYERTDGLESGYELGGSNMYGYKCYDESQSTDSLQDWKHLSIDVTEIVQKAAENYYVLNNSEDMSWLKMEVSFGCIDNVYAYFDDVVLEIDYVNDNTEPFRLKDLFNYIEQNDPVDGNAFNFWDDIDFDPVNLMAFMEADLGLTPGATQEGVNFTNYYRSTDTSITDMISLFEQEDGIDHIDGGESLSFLEMLNYTRYIIDEDETNNIDTPYGKRTEINPDGWVIEDPYVASKAIVNALQDDMFVDEYGNLKSYSTDLWGKELWVLFENLDMYLPWICVYLFMNGWKTSDMYDLFDALGMMKEVKTNYDDVYAKSYGEIRESLYYSSSLQVDGLLGPEITLFEDYPMNITAEMSDPIDDDYLKLYQYLNSLGTRSLIRTTGAILPPTPIYISQPFSGEVRWTVFTFDLRGTVDNTMALNEYEVKIWVENNPGSRIASAWPGTSNPYLMAGSNHGFNDAGAAMLTNYLRQTIEFNGAPFLELNGDLIGLFQFLDDYMFLSSQYSPDGLTYYTNDYSSYTMLNYFDVSAADFVDIITGYDQFTGTFDPNGNGKADDWYAPMGSQSEGGYGWYDREDLALDEDKIYNLNDWGLNVKEDRIYGDPGDIENNGKIIWSSSAQFLDDSFEGVITNPDIYDFEEGAPPIVNLIDMLVWLSQTTGALDSQKLFDWLQGELTFNNYLIQNPSVYGEVISYWTYDRGMGSQKVWNMLENATFNSTGLFNWLQNVKGANPYKLSYELNTWNDVLGTDSPDPMGIIYYMQNPNFVIQPDGGVTFAYHNGLGGTGTEDSVSRELFWNLFNGSWWSENGLEEYWDTSDPWETLPGIIYEHLRDMELEQLSMDMIGPEVTYNIFQMLINLGVLPEDWIYEVERQGVLPLEMLAVYPSLNYTQLLNDAKNSNKQTIVSVAGNFRISLYGLKLYDLNHADNLLMYGISGTDYTAQENLQNFIDPMRYSIADGTFQIY